METMGATKHDDGLFARGYLVSSEEVARPPRPGWVSSMFAGLTVWRDPRLTLTLAQGEERQALLLGHAVDVRKARRTEAEMLADLVARPRRQALAATDFWAGRYILIWSDETGMIVTPDAAATRALFYRTTAPFVAASHAALLAERTRTTKRADMEQLLKRRGVYGLPGDATLWSGIRILTPNQALDVDKLSLTRFWPRGTPRELSVEQAAARVGRKLSASINALVVRERPVLLSLTRGLDSRTTLAATRKHRLLVETFTYANGDYHASDHQFAEIFAPALGMRHRTVRGDGKSPASFRAAMARNNPRGHFARGARAYREAFPADAFHVRSSLGEVGRCFYRDPSRCFPLQTGQDLAKAWGSRRGEIEVHGLEFGDWARRTNFWSVRGYDRFDLFNLEHRMGAWLWGIGAEGDIAFDTHVAFNCRAILAGFLAAPQEARHRGDVFLRIIHDRWPVLLRAPINGRAVSVPVPIEALP